VLDCGGTLRDVAFALKRASLLVGPVPLAALLGSLSQTQVEVTTLALVVPHMLVDRFMADRERTEVPETAADLFWAVVLHEEPLNHGPLGGAEVLVASRSRSPSVRVLLRAVGAVAPVGARGVSPKLADDRAPVSTHNASDRR
jgi:hypothetical protein